MASCSSSSVSAGCLGLGLAEVAPSLSTVRRGQIGREAPGVAEAVLERTDRHVDTGGCGQGRIEGPLTLGEEAPLQAEPGMPRRRISARRCHNPGGQ